MSMEKFSLGFAAACLSFLTVGCQPNLSEYHPAREHSATPAPESTATDPELPARNDSVGSPSEPIAKGEPSDGVSEGDPFPVSALIPVNVIGDVRTLMSIPAGENSAAKTLNANQTGSGTEQGTNAIGTQKPNQIELLVKDRKFQTEPKTGALRVSFDDLDLLKVLNMDPVVANADELMPDWLKSLDGKHIRLRGFMIPTFEAEGLERFVLARDSQLCCFGSNPRIYDLVQVDLKSGKTTNYIPPTRAFDVVGTFHIRMLADDGKPYGLYFIEDATLIDR
jgi:hypothetical protein